MGEDAKGVFLKWQKCQAIQKSTNEYTVKSRIPKKIGDLGLGARAKRKKIINSRRTALGKENRDSEEAKVDLPMR
jgi:hypothetical protein